MTQPWIAGCGLTAFGRHEDTSLEALAARAAREALLQAGLPRAASAWPSSPMRWRHGCRAA